MRIPLMMLTPLEPTGLITLLTLSAVLWISSRVLPYGLPLIVILVSWFFKYSFSLLDRLASGGRGMPVLSVEMIVGTMGEFRWLVPLLLVAAAFFGTGAASFLLGAVLAAIVALVLLSVFPAVLVIQGWTGRLSHSLRPEIWTVVVRALGKDYACLIGCATALAIACIAAPGMIDGVPGMLRIALQLYAWLALVATTGGVSYRNREELAAKLPLVIRQLTAQSSEDLAREREAWVDDIYGAWRGRAADSAFQCVIERLSRSAEPLSELRWLLGRTSSWEPPQLSNRVAAELVSRLLREDREGEALRVVRERRTVDRDFRPRNRDECETLGKLAAQWRDQDTAEHLLRH